MKKYLTTYSNNFENTASQIMKQLWFEQMIQKNEKINIVGSVKYWLCLPGESDVDIWITSSTPRDCFAQTIKYITRQMLENKLLKKISVNNFFDSYPEFENEKEKLIDANNNSRFFLIEVFYYLDDKLKEKINFQIHITERDFIEPFPTLLTLATEERELLLSLKQFVYKELPFFWNRSYLVYQWYLTGKRTNEEMKQYLMDNWYEKLIR